MITKTTKTITTKDGNGKVLSIQIQEEVVETPDVKVIRTRQGNKKEETVQTQTYSNGEAHAETSAPRSTVV